MSSKYVPPAMRNRKKFQQPQVEEKPAVCEFNDTNFPTLGNGQAKAVVWGGAKSFAQLANEWKEKDENDEMVKENEEYQKKKESTYASRHNVPLPKFHPVGRFTDVEEDEEEETVNKPKDDESEWTTVDRRKYRKEKTFEEKIAAQLEAEAKEESVWNLEEQEEYETCWNDKP